MVCILPPLPETVKNEAFGWRLVGTASIGLLCHFSGVVSRGNYRSCQLFFDGFQIAMRTMSFSGSVPGVQSRRSPLTPLGYAVFSLPNRERNRLSRTKGSMYAITIIYRLRAGGKAKMPVLGGILPI